jgi:hypothetical protein
MLFAPDFKGYLDGTSWASTLELEDKAYFKFSGDNSRAVLASLFDGNTQLANLIYANGFWEMIIQSYSEQHAEAVDVQDVLADTFVVNTFGAVPVRVQMSGGLWTTPTDDHRLNFLYLYHKGLRGSVLQRSGLAVRFQIKSTTMLLQLTDITLATSADTQDVSPFSLSGIGYRYQVT